MQEKYVSDFEEIFFNVDNNQEVNEIIEQASEVLSSLIIKYVEIINEMSYGVSKGSENFYTNQVVLLFCRKVAEQLDAINILISKTSFSQAEIILRSLVENAISLEFILDGDTDLKATSYFMQHHYDEISKKEQFIKALNGEGLADEVKAELIAKVERKEASINSLVSKNELFRKINDERNKIKNKNIKWYELFSGPKSFKQMMEAVNLGEYYESLYGGLSMETHGLNAAMGMDIDDECISLKLIREPFEGDSVISLTCTFAISALNCVYKFLGDGQEEKTEFRRFFEEYTKKRDIVIQNLNMIIKEVHQ